MLCLSKQSVEHSLPPLPKCNDLRDHGRISELPDLWPPNSPDLNPIDCKTWGIIQQHVYQTKVQDVNDLMQRRIDVWAGVEQSVIDDATDQRRNISVPEYWLWHKSVDTFKLSLNLLLNRTFFQIIPSFPDIYISQGSVATRLRRSWIFTDHFVTRSLLSPLCETIWKICQRLTKFWTKVGCPVFWLTG